MPEGKSPNGRRRESRVWLGPPGRGGERLARLFGIGPSAVPDVGSRIDELHAAVQRLEQQLRELEGGRGEGGSARLDTAGARRPLVELPHVPLASDRDYWLAHCDEFAVCTHEGVLGVVEGIRFRSRIDRPDLLEVRRGRIGRRSLLVPVEQVEVVDPTEKVLILNGSFPVRGARRRLRSHLGRLRRPLHVSLP